MFLEYRVPGIDNGYLVFLKNCLVSFKIHTCKPRKRFHSVMEKGGWKVWISDETSFMSGFRLRERVCRYNGGCQFKEQN